MTAKYEYKTTIVDTRGEVMPAIRAEANLGWRLIQVLEAVADFTILLERLLPTVAEYRIVEVPPDADPAELKERLENADNNGEFRVQGFIVRERNRGRSTYLETLAIVKKDVVI